MYTVIGYEIMEVPAGRRYWHPHHGFCTTVYGDSADRRWFIKLELFTLADAEKRLQEIERAWQAERDAEQAEEDRLATGER